MISKKVLKQFTFRLFEKMLPEAGEGSSEVQVSEAAVVFVYCEPQDESGFAGLETKFIKNVKWIAGKRGFKNVVLHSFTHLAEASGSPQFAEAFLQSAAARLRNMGYQVTVTPFGWVCD